MRRRVRDKRDRVRQLRVFLEVLRRRNLSRAAERLGLTQPGVSIQLRELEHEYGAILFEREATGVSPTPAGERLHALAGPLVQGVDALFDDPRRCLDAVRGGQVRLAASGGGVAFVLPRHVKRFHDQHPDITVRLDTVSHREGLERLLEEKVDLALGIDDPYPSEKVVYQELCVSRLVLITPLGHPLAGRAMVSAQEASGWPAVVPSAGTYSRRFGETAAERLGVEINAVLEVRGWGLVKRYVEAGIGISVVPDLCVSESDRLAIVAMDLPFPARSYGVFALRDRHLTAPARRFLNVLIPNASEPSPPRGRPGAAARRNRLDR